MDWITVPRGCVFGNVSLVDMCVCCVSIDRTMILQLLACSFVIQ